MVFMKLVLLRLIGMDIELSSKYLPLIMILELGFLQ
jgi:hypothetical protein